MFLFIIGSCTFGCILELLTCIYFIFIVIYCIPHKHHEKCGNMTKLWKEGIKEKQTDLVDTVGVCIINVISVILLVTINKWKNYSTVNLIKAVPKVGHFWLWIGLNTFAVIPSVAIMYFKDYNKDDIYVVVGIAYIMEYVLTPMLALSIHFIKWKILERWIKQNYKAYQLLIRGYDYNILVLYLMIVHWVFYKNLHRWSEIIETTAKNGVVPVAISNVKLFLKTIW